MNINLIEKKIYNKCLLSSEELIFFLNYIVNQTRIIVKDKTFTNKCDLAQGLIGRYLNSLGISNYPCITNKCIMPNVIGHSFIIADLTRYNGKKYIIDPSYIQFLYNDKDYNDLYIKDMRITSKSPFYYANIINNSITHQLLKDGYLELTEENAYLYGTSFYRTLVSIKRDYCFSNINGNTYINSFLNGHEELKKYDYPEITEESHIKR